MKRTFQPSNLVRARRHGFRTRSATVGGRKVLRDDIWGRLRFPFIADHEYYEKHGLYDFPNVDPAAYKFGFDMIEAVKDPEAKEIIRKMIKTKMVEPLQKVVATK